MLFYLHKLLVLHSSFKTSPSPTTENLSFKKTSLSITLRKLLWGVFFQTTLGAITILTNHLPQRESYILRFPSSWAPGMVWSNGGWTNSILFLCQNCWHLIFQPMRQTSRKCVLRIQLGYYTLQGGDPVVTPTFGIILWNFTSYQFHYTFCCYAHQNIFVMCCATKLKHLGSWAICSPDSTFATVLVVHLASCCTCVLEPSVQKSSQINIEFSVSKAVWPKL